MEYAVPKWNPGVLLLPFEFDLCNIAMPSEDLSLVESCCVANLSSVQSLSL